MHHPLAGSSTDCTLLNTTPAHAISQCRQSVKMKRRSRACSFWRPHRAPAHTAARMMLTGERKAAPLPRATTKAAPAAMAATRPTSRRRLTCLRACHAHKISTHESTKSPPGGNGCNDRRHSGDQIETGFAFRSGHAKAELDKQPCGRPESLAPHGGPARASKPGNRHRMHACRSTTQSSRPRTKDRQGSWGSSRAITCARHEHAWTEQVGWKGIWLDVSSSWDWH